MKTKSPGVYCFWNKINNKVYVGSAQDLSVRIQNHFDNASSNEPLQHAFKKYGLEAFQITQVITETHADALQLEQMCLDYIFGKDKPKYNLSSKVGGGRVRESYENHRELSLKGLTKEEHKKLCLQGRTKTEHRELSEAGGGPKAKPFFIKEYPSGRILLKAESTYDKKAQELLIMSRPLFLRLKSGQIVYLEYIDQSLKERAELLGRSTKADYSKIMAFKQTLNLKRKDGRTAFLENYTTYYEAGRMLELITKPELGNFCEMISGKRPSASGWSLIK